VLTTDFIYNLPEELIAKYPPKERGTTRLLVLNMAKQSLMHRHYFDMPEYVQAGDVIVLNQTKVLNVRTFPIVKRTGRKVELLFLNKLQTDGTIHNSQFASNGAGTKISTVLNSELLIDNCEFYYALIGRAKHVKIGDELVFEDGERVKVESREAGSSGFNVKVATGMDSTIFKKYGHVPLPPYIKRPDEADDRIRYNTIFARRDGSVAAPTASLNLTDDILDRIREKDAKIVYVNLKVGWGTFAPVNTQKVEDFTIHHEEFELPEDSADVINEAIGRGGNIWAFGTTATRVLESCAVCEEKEGSDVEKTSGESYDFVTQRAAAKSSKDTVSIKQKNNSTTHYERFYVKSQTGQTNLFIYPGYQWKVVNRLVTNFHAPKSSLIMLVSSFAGTDFVKYAYEEAIKERYSFLSYGDSMLVIN